MHVPKTCENAVGMLPLRQDGGVGAPSMDSGCWRGWDPEGRGIQLVSKGIQIGYKVQDGFLCVVVFFG